MGRCLCDAVFASEAVLQSASDPDTEPEPELQPGPLQLPTGEHFATSQGSNWKGWVDINRDVGNKFRTPSSLSCQPSVVRSGGKIAAVLKIFGEYIPVSITPSEGGVLSIDSTDGQLSSICTLTAGG